MKIVIFMLVRNALRMQQQVAAMMDMDICCPAGNICLQPGISGLPGFNAIDSTFPEGHLSFQFHIGNGFSIWHSRYQIKRPVDMHARSDTPVLELHLPMGGGLSSSWDKKPPLVLTEAGCAMTYVPHIDSRTSLEEGCYSGVDVHYSPQFLATHVKESGVLGHFLEKVEHKQPVLLAGKILPAHIAMPALARCLVGEPVSEGVAGAYFEGIALQLLALMLHQAENRWNVTTSLNRYETEQVRAVRDILSIHPEQRYSMTVLSRMVGIGELRLLRLFRQLYGKTPFDFARQRRLELAAALLLDSNDSIQVIAEKVGYPDQANLTVAFKKQFGCNPAEYRRKR